jgi:putative membrane protein
MFEANPSPAPVLLESIQRKRECFETSMKSPIFLTATAVASLMVCAASAQSMGTKSADSTFAMKSAQGGMAEVELGNLAVQKASSQKVKQFGQQMVEDHTKANEELKTIAAGKGITLPSKIDPPSQATQKHLSMMTGAAFDRAYMEDMVKDHQKDVAEFQKEADSGTDPDLKAFAAKTLPTLQQHLKMAQETLSSVKSGGSMQ